VSQNTELYKLALWSNQLTSIDLSKNTELSELDLDRNRLESLDITGLDYLWLFYYNYNYLSSITGCPEDECDFDYQLEAGFVAAAGITGVPRFAVVGVPLTLAGTVFPSDATNKTISQWYTYGDAVIDGNELTAEYSGTVNICAVIENGLAADEDYEPCFNIYVLDNGYEVAITQPSNGTISVMNGASPVADGDIIGRGTVLTLSVTPNTGYSFTGWWDGNTNPTRTFMVAKDVEISALFENTPIRLPQIASASNISVRAMGNNIVLQNLPAGAKVEVFSLNGKLISGKSFNQANQGSDMSISVQTKGMYIVKVSTGSATQTLRVSVR
jgi:Leucine-rich repeat (LRR) protein